MVRHHLLRYLLHFMDKRLSRASHWPNARGWLILFADADRRTASSNAEGADSRQSFNGPGIASDRAATSLDYRRAIPGRAFNRTRFAVDNVYPNVAYASGGLHQPGGSVPDRPGAVDILMPLKERGVSMTRFESSGTFRTVGYYFSSILQGRNDHVHAALSALQSLCAFTNF
jgi:prephenate dehydratase